MKTSTSLVHVLSLLLLISQRYLPRWSCVAWGIWNRTNDANMEKSQLKLKLKIPQWRKKWALSNDVQTHHQLPLGSLGHGHAVPVPLVSRDGPSHGAALQLQVLADVQLPRLWLDDQPQPTLRGVVARPWRQRWSEEEVSHICRLLTHSTLKNKSTLRKWSSQSWLCYTKCLCPQRLRFWRRRLVDFFF